MATNQFINSLRKIFKIADKKLDSGEKTVHPGYVDSNSKNQGVKAVKFPTEIQKLYDFWVQDNFEDSNTLKNRMNRYSSFMYAYYNSAVFSKCINLYADETVQNDVNNQIIGVEAKKPVQTYIYDFLNKIGITADLLHETAFNIVLFGDAFWINSINSKEKTIEDVTSIEPSSVQDRIEFNASQVNKDQQKYGKHTSFIQKDSKLRAVAKILNDSKKDEDYSQYFKNYLFGYWLGEKMYIAPWNMSHFRLFSTISEFFPFGRPLMINSLAPFRQLQTSKNLMTMARVQSFPFKWFKVHVDENMDQAEQWEVVNESREEYANLGTNLTEKEQFAIASELWTPDNLLDMENVETRMNLDDIADVELLRDELIMSTDIPKGYLIVDRASFGTSGQALLRQHKPFARAVFKIQSAILKQLVQLIRMQFVISGKFEYDTDFELTMPFPEIEEGSDRLRIKNDTMRLAKDILDNIGTAIGLDRDETLPPEVVKDVFGKYSFMDQETIDNWIDTIVAAKDAASEDDKDDNNLFNSVKSTKKLMEKIEERLTPSLIQECYFSAKKKRGLFEHTGNNRHFYNSRKIDNMEKLILDLHSGKIEISNKLEE